MKKPNESFTVEISKTGNSCAAGEKAGNTNLEKGKIPVLSCEGACIRGEIARLAANFVAKEEPYRRGCHGELFTVPSSALARWIKTGKIDSPRLGLRRELPALHGASQTASG
ncbi:MAG: hypothetical protein M0033_01260 [Nitrospiraceae bacterium]|nr:hypothetical protein [Nitrospiraceae bacterium]